MRREAPPPPGFWKTVGLLLRAARVRSVGGRRRQRQLLHNKTGTSGSSTMGVLGIVLASFLGILIHGSAGFMVFMAVHTSQRYQAERRGEIVVGRSLFRDVKKWRAHKEWKQVGPSDFIVEQVPDTDRGL
jgi:hypothetical protein